MHTYIVNMESGHVYWVVADSHHDAMREAQRMAMQAHGERDYADYAILAED